MADLLSTDNYTVLSAYITRKLVIIYEYLFTKYFS